MNRRLLRNRCFLYVQKIVSGLLIFAFAFANLGSMFDMPIVPAAEAAQSTLDLTANATGFSHIHANSQSVFISDQTGYKFYRDAGGYCVYRKTTDGGVTWSSTTTVDANLTCIGIAVWYDRWTASSTGNFIHIVTIDTTASDPFYNRLDTTNDSLLLGTTPVSVVTGSGQGGSFTAGQNYPAITKATNGVIYIAESDNTDSFVVRCSTTCQTNTNWTEVGTNPLDLLPDENLLMPLLGGNIMLINRSITSNEDIRSKIWNNTTWSASWTMIDGNATDNVTYPVGMAAVESTTTPGQVYLAYIANNATLGTDDEIRAHYYNGSSWATSTKVLTGSTTIGITNVAVSLDGANDDVYVAYTARATAATAATGRVWWERSKDKMNTWNAPTGPISNAAGDMYGVDINGISDQRIYATWENNSLADIYGDTIQDIFPGIHATTTGTQNTNISASSSNFYVGGSFVLYDNYKLKGHTVTGITITENGTVDASTNLKNIKLFYEKDTTAPYDCASESYSGTETQFGSAVSSGFTAANGTASFTGSVTVSSTSAMCIYPVLDIKRTATNNQTIDLTIANPATDVTVTGGTAGPSGIAQPISGATTILNDNLTQSRYHWRNDDGTEATATSKTGGVEGVSFGGYQKTPIRLRMEVANKGGTTSLPVQYRLETSVATTTCAAATQWKQVGTAGSGWSIFNSSNLIDGANTTNIAVGQGGVTDDNPTFVTPNGGVKDTSAQTGNITLTQTQFTELEYAIQASSTISNGTNYCFRVTKAGSLLDTYSLYPSLTVNTDVTVSATGTQAVSQNAPLARQYLGGVFVIKDNFGPNTVTINSIKITENGTIDASSSLKAVRLRYDLDVTAPYDCKSESYAGTESQFGATSTAGFSGPDGTLTFSGSVVASTTRTVCLYVVYETKKSVINGDTINVQIANPSTDVLVTGGSASPSTPVDINGVTTQNMAVLTQTRYHWRSFIGTQATATSKTNGVENTPVNNIGFTEPIRLRMEVTNPGANTSSTTALRLEYGAKITNCASVNTWTDVNASGGAFDMFNGVSTVDGANTTNIAVATGGVTDDAATFKVANAGMKDANSKVATTTLLTTEFIEPEFSIKENAAAGYNNRYCFRLTDNGVPLRSYTRYPELTTSPDRDFYVQRGTVSFSGVTTLLRAGVDYVAPAASTSAFMRITNTGYTGAGKTTVGGTQNAKDTTVYISNPSNILNSITLTRPATAIASTTRVSWEIVEFIGAPGSDNEFKVRSQGRQTYVATSLTATATAAVGIVNNAKVAVFITGQLDPDTTATNYNSGQSVSRWLTATQQPAFQRGDAGADASILSYAVVEFTGQNWKVQRIAHTYTASGTVETQAITAVNSLSRTFIHTQKMSGVGVTNTNAFGHEVWLSSIGALSFMLEPGTASPNLQTSVAWVIENTQTTSGVELVTRSNGSSAGGGNPVTLSLSIGTTLSNLTNTSIFVNNRAASSTTLYPRPILGVTIASSTNYELWRSDSGSRVTYRTEIVEWPTARLDFSQKDYRLYVDNNALIPTTPWPQGGSPLGEDTAMTGNDGPMGNAEHIRLRMNFTVKSASLPALGYSFKLQYAQRVTSCTAIPDVSWTDIGSATSSAIWRGYNAPGVANGTNLSIDPPTGGDLKLTVSNSAGTYQELNNTPPNPFLVAKDGNIEYDWHVQQNGAVSTTTYCFRMVNSSGAAFGEYLNYPQVRTADFTPKSQNWRFYSDINNETPTSALAGENAAPIDFGFGSTTKLRISVKETKNITQNNIRFKLQYSEYSNFLTAYDVTASSSCMASSTWCYANGAGTDNAVISTKVLSDADSCTSGVGTGCGTHNISPVYKTGFTHVASTTSEYEFTLQSKAVRASAVYYFRLFDLVQNVPVVVNTSKSYPSLVAKSSSLVFNLNGLSSGTTTEGVLLNTTSSATDIAYGALSVGTDYAAAYRLNVNTNATEGYRILMYGTQNLINSYGSPIPNVTGSNAVPLAWSVGCSGSATGCFGYHAGDDTLSNGSTRFALDDTYAALSSTTPQEVMYSSVPINDTHDIVYKLRVSQNQAAGDYQSNIIFLAVPVF